MTTKTTTSSTITCDRCGVTCAAPGTGYLEPFNCSAHVTMRAEVRDPLDNGAGYTREWDLCGACLVTLEAFMAPGEEKPCV